MFRILLEKASGLPIYALLLVGNFYQDVKKFEQSLEIYFVAPAKLEESEVPLKYLVIHQIGFTYSKLEQYSNALDNLGEYNKALDYYTRALAGREKILGLEHKDTLSTINAIDLIWDYLGRNDEASEHLSMLTEEEDEIIGPGYEDTLPTINNIHKAYDSLEPYDIPSADLIQTLSGEEKKVSEPERKNTRVIQKLLGHGNFFTFPKMK
ncbi:hypothetical protein MKX08_003253 [Trichoderma sp. CBMAI-0020]|nr:hypothetical protein MKX08_003253 [Trichoderma sp. CBMAI-0020]